MTDDRKRAHLCPLCDAPLIEVLRTHPDAAHPLHGEPAQLGAWHPHAMRARLVLADGSTTACSVCADCLPTLGEQLPALWRKVLAAFVFETQYRNRTPALDAELIRMIDNVPLGVLAAERWSEVAG